MTDLQDKIILGKTAFDVSNQVKTPWSCLGQTIQIADCVSVPSFCHFVDHRWILSENYSFKNLWRTNGWGWIFVQCGRIHFTLTKIMNKLVFSKGRVFISFLGPFDSGKSQLIYNWQKKGTFQPKSNKT